MRALALAALLAASLAALLPTVDAAAPRIVITPDPVPAQTPVDVQVLDLPRAEALVNGSLKTCLAKDGKATFCLLPMPMKVVNGTLVGRSADGFPAGEQVGVNVTARYADGTTLELPAGIADPLAAYVFFAVEGGKETPALAIPLAFGSLAALAALRSRRRA